MTLIDTFSTGFEYGRSGNPTRNVLEKCLASLDNGKYGLAFASGLGTTTAILTMMNSGDHMVIGDDVYGGTNRVIRQVAARLGITFDFVDPTDLKALEAAIKPNTKLFWVETPTNPLLKVVDIESVAKIAHKRDDIIVVVDNTFLTSYFQRPLELGADVVAYSLTKYMNGHSDVIMGAAVTSSEDIYNRLNLKTLALRMEQHQKNAIQIAEYLEKHPLVEKVLHPGLPSHPQHQLALKQTYGYSGVFSFYIKGNLETSRKFLKALEMFTLAESLGGYESLAELPVIMTHASVPAEDRVKLGITDTLIRLSVGLEDADDLIEDIEKAFKASQA
uniref:cystathionine gamma-lyase n=1 Tax=Megaselia scalaris TaxID=36166 RepID=T1GQM3_MEGSC